MTTGHLDAVQLAEHAEGLLNPQVADAVQAHLRQCEHCRQSAAALQSVTARLAAAPAELAIPPTVADRIDRALVAERDRVNGHVGAADTASDDAAATVVQLGWFRRRAPQLLAAAAAVGVLGFAGYAIGTSGLGSDDSDESGALEIASDRAGDGAGDTADDAPEAEAGGDEEAATLEQEESADAAPFDADDPEDLATSSALEAEVRDLVGRTRAGAEVAAEPGCGMALASEVDRRLVGTAPTHVTREGAVLVVLEFDDSVVEGWVLPSCDARSDDAVGQPRLVAID